MSKFFRSYYDKYVIANTTEDKYAVIAGDGTLIPRDRSWYDNLVKFNILFPNGYKHAIRYLEFYNQRDSGAGNVKRAIPVLTKPIYHKLKTNFRMLSLYPNYFISESGEIYYKPDDITIIIKRDRDYPSFGFKRTTVDKPILERVHRMVALAWVKNENWEENDIVDHINGIKSQFDAINLRWVNNRENTRLATVTDLRPDIIPVKVRNINTGVVTQFGSLTQACDFIGRSRISTTVSALRDGKVWEGTNGKFEMKYLDDKSPWYYTKYKAKAPKLERYIFMVHIPREDTRNSYYTKSFISPRDAYINLTGEDSIGMLDENVINTLKALFPTYKFEFAKNEGYEAYNGNKEFKAPTAQALSYLIGVPKSTIIKYAITKERLGVWVFRKSNLLNGEWYYPELKKKANKAKTIRIKVVDSGEILEFTSIRQAATAIHIDRTKLTEFIKNKTLIRNKYLPI